MSPPGGGDEYADKDNPPRVPPNSVHTDATDSPPPSVVPPAKESSEHESSERQPSSRPGPPNEKGDCHSPFNLPTDFPPLVVTSDTLHSSISSNGDVELNDAEPGAPTGSGTPLSRRRGPRTRSPRSVFWRVGGRGCGWPRPQRGRGRARGENPHLSGNNSWLITSGKRMLLCGSAS